MLRPRVLPILGAGQGGSKSCVVRIGLRGSNQKVRHGMKEARALLTNMTTLLSWPALPPLLADFNIMGVESMGWYCCCATLARAHTHTHSLSLSVSLSLSLSLPPGHRGRSKPLGFEPTRSCIGQRGVTSECKSSWRLKAKSTR